MVETAAFDETSPESSMTLGKKISYSLIGGAIITLVTSIIPNNTAIGASNIGYPFPWFSQPLFPPGSSPLISEAPLLDTIVWTFTALVMIIIYQALKSR